MGRRAIAGEYYGMSVLWIWLYIPLILLVVLAFTCMHHLPQAQRRGFLPAVVAVGISAVILFGGEWLLNRYGLTWRTYPKLLLCAATWVAGLTAGVLTVRYVERWTGDKKSSLGRWGRQALALFCLCTVMCVGTVKGCLWGIGPREVIGTWEGQTVVMAKWRLFDDSYDLYKYSGPLVRETEVLISEADSGEEAGDIFLRYREEFKATAVQVLARKSADGVELPWGVHSASLSSGNYVEFYMGGAGIIPASVYWGVVYHFGKEPVAFEELGYTWDGTAWRDRGGRIYVRPLDERWYAYEAHY